jgi:dephospho-CoA kinase
LSNSAYRIGLTGGIASGKSTVAQLFRALGAPVVDADEIARDVVEPGQPLLARISGRFGTSVIAADGSLDRRALRDRVFADAQARADLESMMHPAILAELNRQADEARHPYVLLAIPLLVEKNLAGTVNRVLVVDCDESVQIRRLQARDGSTLAQAQAIIQAQAPRAARLHAADDVISNAGDIHTLRDQVFALHTRYLELASQAQP